MTKCSFTNARDVAVKGEIAIKYSTPRFLTDDEKSREQPSSIRPCSRLLVVWFLGPIINTSVFFHNLVVRNYSSSSFFISTMHSISFSIWCVSPGREEIKS